MITSVERGIQDDEVLAVTEKGVTAAGESVTATERGVTATDKGVNAAAVAEECVTARVPSLPSSTQT